MTEMGNDDWSCRIESEKGTRPEEVGSTRRPEKIGRFENSDGEMSDDQTGKRTAIVSELMERMDSFRVDSARVFG